MKLSIVTILLSLAWSPLAWAVPAEEVVPAGAWFIKLTETRVTEQEAINRLKQEGALKNYVVPSEHQPEATSGEIQRSRSETEARVTYGLGDQWNLAFRVPYRQVEQSSSLANDTTDEAVQARLDTLGSETLTGVGDVRLAVLYRPIFSDRNGLVWAFGMYFPGSSQEVPYLDSSTLAIAEPVKRYLVGLQYTRYPAFPRSRFDLAVEVSNALKGPVELAGGGQGEIYPGSRVVGKLGWLQELGALSYGLESEYKTQGANRMDGNTLGDKTLRWVYRVHLGFGNLAELEAPGGGWPYRVMLGWERIHIGFNTPTDDVISLSLETFF